MFKGNCTIIEFKGKNFAKSHVYIDQDMLKKFQDLDGLAKLCNIQIQPLRSFVLQNNFKETTDLEEAPFYVGKALKYEINDVKGKKICDKDCLKSNLPINQSICI